MPGSADLLRVQVKCSNTKGFLWFNGFGGFIEKGPSAETLRVALWFRGLGLGLRGLGFRVSGVWVAIRSCRPLYTRTCFETFSPLAFWDFSG